MKVYADLLLEMLTRVEMGRFEIGTKSVDQALVDRPDLFEQEMAVAILDRSVGIEPRLECGGWGGSVCTLPPTG